MEGFRTFLESSTIHGLAYISTTTRFSKVFWIFTVISGFATAAFLIHSSFQSWSDSPIKTTVEKFPISKIKFPKVTVCPPRGTLTDLNYDLMLAENKTFEEKQLNDLQSFINDVVDNHVYLDKWTQLNEENRYFNWYHGYTKFLPPVNSIFFGKTHTIESSALSGVVTTENFGDVFQKDMIEKKAFYRVTVSPRDNFSLDPNVTLHIKVEIERIAGYSKENMFITPGFYKLELNNAFFNVSPPVEYSFQYQRDISPEELSQVKMDIMPGLRVSWHYTSNNGTELIELGKPTLKPTQKLEYISTYFVCLTLPPSSGMTLGTCLRSRTINKNS